MFESASDSLVDWRVEGKAKFRVGNAFYRPESKAARDLGVLAAAIYRFDVGSLRVLDAMSGCGVRSLRYWLESQADWIWTNDSNPELKEVLEPNLREAIASGCCKLTYQSANRIFFECYHRQDYYDFVDVDGFGSGVPFLDTMLWATKIGGLLYLTCTDGRSLTGHLPENSLRAYGAYARSHPAAQEQALRLIVGKVQQQAAMKGLGISPIFCLFAKETYRVMLRLSSSPDLTSKNYGFLGYCHYCGDYQTVSWRRIGKVSCQHDGAPLTLSGPMWLGKLHEPEQLSRFGLLAREWNWLERVELIEVMEKEAELPPYFYTLSEIGHRGQMDIPKRSHLIRALNEGGYRATSCHIDRQAIKTDASLAVCISVARSLSSR